MTAAAIRWGILGAGGIARAFAGDLNAVGIGVAAVGSRSLDTAEQFGNRFDIPNRHGSYADLVADPSIHAVYVATPHPFHAEHALLALNAGKHVLVEKPFTLNAAEAKRVTDRAAELGLVVLEAMWTRFLPHMRRLREILAAGTLGEVRAVLADHTQDLPKNPDHRLNNPELGGGALLDLGIYPVSFAVDILGVPVSVQAAATFTSTGVDRASSILMQHVGGASSVLYSALDVKGPNRAAVIGTGGRIELDDTWYMPTTFRVFDNAGQLVEIYDEPVRGRGMQFEAFELARLVESGPGKDDRLPPAESVAIMAVLDEVRRQIGLRYPGE